jgi:predicted nucleic acid-binding protein
MVMTDGEAPVFIDTNVLIRYTIASAPLHTESQNAIKSLWHRGTEIWISRQVLREYAAVLTRPQTYTKPLSGASVAAELRAFEARFQVADDHAAVTSRLVQLLENVPIGGKQVHDANIVATMQAYNIRRLLTLNTADFARFTPSITLLTLEDVLKQAEDSDEQS